MNISHFIRELIVRNECVILRGVGGFDTAYRHAEFNKERKQIVPPSKTVGFRPDWVNDNGVLEEHIALSLDIDQKKASDYIDQYVKSLYRELEEKGEAEIKEVGVLTMDQSGIIGFREKEDENYLADSFGLDSLEIELEQTPQTVYEAKPPVITPGKSRKLTGWYVTIGVLLLLISITVLLLFSIEGGIPIFGTSKNKLQTKESDVIVFGGQQSEEDTLMQAIEETLDEKTSTKKALALDTERQNQRVIHVKKYYLIAGSFKSMKNAKILEEQLLRKGFSTEIVLFGNNQYRVVIGTYSERKPAIEELQRIRIQLDQSVWLLESKE